MSTKPAQFPGLEDQTNEDFFDKLVDDDLEPTEPEPAEISRVLSNLSISEVEKSECVEKENLLPRVDSASSAVLDSAEESSVAKCDAPKGTSVREVQWSAFSVGSEQFGQEDGFSSDLLAENGDALGTNSDFLEDHIENLSSKDRDTDMNDTQDWENLYPGWKYDHSTGQWYQLDANQANTLNTSTSQSVLETVAGDCRAGSVNNWNHGCHGTVEYPPNMIFDSQYPEWYYDTITQQWYTLESYNQGSNSSLHSAAQEQLAQEVDASASFNSAQGQSFYGDIIQPDKETVQSQVSRGFGGSSQANRTQDKSLYGTQNWSFNNNGLSDQYTSQNSGTQPLGGNWNTSMSNYSQPKIWQPEPVSSNVNFYSSQQSKSTYKSMTGSQIGQQTGFRPIKSVVRHNYASANDTTAQHSFVPKESTYQIGQPKVQTLHEHLSNSYHGETGADKFGNANVRSGLHSFVPEESTYQYNEPKVATLQEHLSNNYSYYAEEIKSNYSQQSTQGANSSDSQFSYAPNERRSSAGRPQHALVAFGFGGKLIVVKHLNSFDSNLDVGSQGNEGAVVSILTLSEVVTEKADSSSITCGNSYSYFHALCQQSFPGPLVGGNVATRDLNKWIDERIISCGPSCMDFRKGELLKLLYCLLKLLCQHDGKLRSPFGANPLLEEKDSPELALTKLFASARKKGAHSFSNCVRSLPSEGRMQATATEMQALLVSGRKKEALLYAQEGQLWGPALVLAAKLGNQFYVDTVRKMAHHQFAPASPLRTLCLLIAGQPADVFSVDNYANSIPGNAFQASKENPSNSMLDNWEENLAMITANRTKDDELVILHLGDSLLKERGEITAAHTCYLVAEANFETYSDSARLCLIGADHWKCSRTFASPEAIQRTEVYEYSKVLGNSQFLLLPFQPYKLVYACMLAEVGKVSESLRYCQAALKLLKSPARTPEVEMLKTLWSSLEERLRTHQQGGYSSNMATAKFVGKLFTSIDRSFHRMMGAPLEPLEIMQQNSNNDKENFSLRSSQSTMAMSSLIPSPTTEAPSQSAGSGNRKNLHHRSASEPFLGLNEKQAADSANAQTKGSATGAPSRFGLIGSQLFQKTIGWVSRSRPDRQAKLGETNKFYYDEKLKRWMEEGAEPPAEAAALPPPPTKTSFEINSSNCKINSPLTTQNFNGGQEVRSPKPSEPSLGIPPIPPSQNQFSARARTGVRSRYVDTFNKGVGSATTKSFQSSSTPSAKPPVNAKFFVPTAPTVDTSIGKETSCSPPPLLPSPTPPPPSIQRFPSMESLTSLENKSRSHSRAASWSGTYPELPDSVVSGFGSSPPQFLRPDNSSPVQPNGGKVHNQLDEVTF